MIQDPRPETSKRNFVLLFLHLIMQRDVERFGCEFFAKRGFNIKLVSCWNAIYTTNSKDYELGDFKNVPKAKSPSSREELEVFLDTLSPVDFIVTNVPLNPKTFWLFQALDKRGLRYSILSLGTIPSTFACRLNSPSDLFKCLKTQFHTMGRLASRLVTRMRQIKAFGFAYFKLKEPLFLIRSGAFRTAFSIPAPFVWRSRVIEVESFDMGWIRRLESQKIEALNYKYAVFIDSALGLHPDWKILGIQQKKIEVIKADLKRTLDILEKKIGLPIVIACHPKAKYTEADFEILFAGRPAFKNNTPALVRGADLVIGHFSTSFAYAIIFRKPVILLTSHQMRADIGGIHCDYFASWLHQQPINMSLLGEGDNDSITIPPVDEKIYERFTHNFVCSRNANKGEIWSIVADEFEDYSRTI